MNFYNENDPFAAEWLRQLIAVDFIAPGIVDERSIEDIRPEELSEFKQCHFFAGIGVWSYALRQAGWPDDEPVWTGSCPCQPYSAAGKRKGIADERHLWPAQHWLIEQSKPNTFFGEQVASKDARTWFEIVSDDLERSGYAVGAAITAACGFGAPQLRKRLYLVGHSECARLPRFEHNSGLSGATKTSLAQRSDEIVGAWRKLETSPTSIPNLDGAPLWLARKLLHGYGNALCAAQATGFIKSFMEINNR